MGAFIVIPVLQLLSTCGATSSYAVTWHSYLQFIQTILTIKFTITQ